MSTGFLGDPDDVEKIILRPDITFQESQDLYKKWANSGTYDNIHGKDRNIYAGQVMLAEAMKRLFPKPSLVRVLDAGAGSGLTGEQLWKLGFTNIDALEPVNDFANSLRKIGIYQNIYNQPIAKEYPLHLPNDTFDAICVVGAFGPGAIPPSAVPEFIRLIKPGGYWVNLMREEYFVTVPMYRNTLKPMLETLVKQGKMQQLEWTVYPSHFRDKAGVRMIYKITS